MTPRQHIASQHDRPILIKPRNPSSIWSLEVEKLKITATNPSTISFIASLGDPSRTRVLRREWRAVERQAPGDGGDGNKQPSGGKVPRLRKVDRKIDDYRVEKMVVEDRMRRGGLVSLPRAESQEIASDSDSGLVEYESEDEQDQTRHVKPRSRLGPREADTTGLGALASTAFMMSTLDLSKHDDSEHQNRPRNPPAEQVVQNIAKGETASKEAASREAASREAASREAASEETATRSRPSVRSVPKPILAEKPQLPRRRRQSVPVSIRPLSRANSTSTNATKQHRRRSTSISLDHVQSMTAEDYMRAEKKRIDRLAPPKIGEPLGPYILRLLDPDHRSHISSIYISEEDCIERWYRLEGSLRPGVGELKQGYLWRMATLHASRAREERILHGVEMPVLGSGMQREVDETRWEVVEGSMRPFVGETQEEYRKRMMRPWLLEDGHAAPTPEVIAAKLAAKMRWEAYCGGT